MANYATMLLLEQVYGDRERMEFSRRHERDHAWFHVPDLYPPPVRTPGGDYDRGPWVMWMLQQEVGREDILAGLRAFIEEYRTGPGLSGDSGHAGRAEGLRAGHGCIRRVRGAVVFRRGVRILKGIWASGSGPEIIRVEDSVESPRTVDHPQYSDGRAFPVVEHDPVEYAPPPYPGARDFAALPAGSRHFGQVFEGRDEPAMYP